MRNLPAILLALACAACAGQPADDPAEIFAARLPVSGVVPASWESVLETGVYLVEIVEKDIDVHATIRVNGSSATLENRLARHGALYDVVTLRTKGPLRVVATSVDHPGKRGAVAFRLLRWARNPDEERGDREAGYVEYAMALRISVRGVDRFVSSTAPSLSLAMQGTSLRGDGIKRVAIVSDPVYPAQDGRTHLNKSPQLRGTEYASHLARLRYSAIEANAVSRGLRGAELIELKGFDANTATVSALARRDLDVLHIATHAVARRDAPEQSALFLSGIAPDGSPLHRTG